MEDFPVYPWSIENHLSRATRSLFERLKREDEEAARLSSCKDSEKLTIYQEWMSKVMGRNKSTPETEYIDEEQFKPINLEEETHKFTGLPQENEAIFKAKLRNALVQRWGEKQAERKGKKDMRLVFNECQFIYFVILVDKINRLQEAIFNLTRELENSIAHDVNSYAKKLTT